MLKNDFPVKYLLFLEGEAIDQFSFAFVTLYVPILLCAVYTCKILHDNSKLFTVFCAFMNHRSPKIYI